MRAKISKKLLLQLSVGGGIVFWLTTIATSLLPIAAEYRAAFSNWSMQTVWVGSVFMGIIIGCCISYLLLRLSDKFRVKSPILKSVILSTIALIIAISLIDIPMYLMEPSASLYFFLIGVIFNTTRFLLLGITVGCLYKRLK